MECQKYRDNPQIDPKRYGRSASQIRENAFAPAAWSRCIIGWVESVREVKSILRSQSGFLPKGVRCPQRMSGAAPRAGERTGRRRRFAPNPTRPCVSKAVAMTRMPPVIARTAKPGATGSQAAAFVRPMMAFSAWATVRSIPTPGLAEHARGLGGDRIKHYLKKIKWGHGC